MNKDDEARFDLEAVRGRRCVDCSLPIGDEAFVERPIIARFGVMRFAHRRCDEEVVAPAACGVVVMGPAWMN